MSDEPKRQLNNRAKIVIGFAIAVLLIGAAGGYYWYTHRTLTAEQKAAQGEKEMKKMVAQIGKLIMLPGEEGGQPALYEVSDPQMLSGQQAFFKDATKGDRLLIYPKSGRAILYNPSKNILVNVGPVTFDQNAAGTQSSGKVTTPAGAKATNGTK